MMNLVQHEEWMDHANCLGVNPELFFPERGQDSREAKAVCAGCTVRTECLEYAMANGITHGVWGGLSHKQRRRIVHLRVVAS